MKPFYFGHYWQVYGTNELDDTFEFHCKSCGKCFKNRHDLILTPYDVFRVASYLCRTTKEIIEQY